MIHFTSDPQTPKWGLKSGTEKFLWLKQISDSTSLHPLPIAIGIGGLGVIIANKIKYDNSTI